MITSKEADEIVEALLEEIEVIVEVHTLGRVDARIERYDDVMEVMKDMQKGEVER